MPRYADRNGEDIFQFLSREGWWHKKEAIQECIDNGTLTVNGKKPRKTYKPKKGDIIKFLSWSFTVAE